MVLAADGLTKMGSDTDLESVDPEIGGLVRRELRRQQETIELIASENFTPVAVLQAVGSVLTNKYAEGYPDKRYYGGCEVVDQVETLAIERVKALYGAEHANVQPHSGSTANQAAYFAALDHGDVVLAMRLEHGGHLTHGLRVNFSGREYTFHHYCVDETTGRIDYDQVRRLAQQHRPRLIVAGASAYPREIDFAAFRAIADDVGAQLMVDMAHIAGLVAAEVHPSPVPFAEWVTTTTHKTLAGPRGGAVLCREEFGPALDKAVFPGLQGGPLMHVIAGKAVCFKLAATEPFREKQRRTVENARALAEELVAGGLRLVSGGTDNHLLLVDFNGSEMTGKLAEDLVHRVGITTNKNSVPGDKRPPTVTSGLRLGTPAVTTRGFGVEEIAGGGARHRRDPDPGADRGARAAAARSHAEPWSRLIRSTPSFPDRARRGGHGRAAPELAELLHGHRLGGGHPFDLPAPARGRRPGQGPADTLHRVQRCPSRAGPLRRARVPAGGKRGGLGRAARALPRPPRRAERHHPGRLSRHAHRRRRALQHAPALRRLCQDDRQRWDHGRVVRRRVPGPAGGGDLRRGGRGTAAGPADLDPRRGASWKRCALS